MRFELTTPTLARLCSTPELRPHPVPLVRGEIIPFPPLCKVLAGRPGPSRADIDFGLRRGPRRGYEAPDEIGEAPDEIGPGPHAKERC